MRAGVLVALVLAAACGPSEGDPDAGPDAGTSVTCQNDARAVTLPATAASKDGGTKVVVASADPAAPVRGNNSWIVRFEGAAGPMTPDAVDVVPFMPDHGHGASVKPKATRNADGTWTIAPLSFFMPGVWQVTFHVTPPGGGAEAQVVVGVCVAG